MKKKLSLMIAALAAFAAFGFPTAPAMAACEGSNDDSRETRPVYDENGNQIGEEPTGEDYLFTDPAGRGTIVYGDASQDERKGYIGVTGPTGYIELSGDDDTGLQVDGSTDKDEVNGNVQVGSSPSICLNDNSAP